MPYEALFKGEINERTVSEFVAKHPPGSIKTIGLFSLGGDVTASIRFARWVRENNLDVFVQRICHSGCASYVFPAGRHKTIGPKANVIWHGSMEEKDIRELQAEYENVETRFKSDSESVTDEEKVYLRKFHERYLNIERQRVLQKEFYKEIGVNEAIMRLGQEPRDYGIDGWTATVKAMKWFGIDDVSAASDYGTIEYMQQDQFVATLEEGKLLSFDVDDSGQPISSQANVKYIHLPSPVRK